MSEINLSIAGNTPQPEVSADAAQKAADEILQTKQAPSFLNAKAAMARMGVSAATGLEKVGPLIMFVTEAGQIGTIAERTGAYRTLPLRVVEARIKRLSDMAQHGYDPKTKTIIDRKTIWDFCNKAEALVKKAREIRCAKGLDKGFLGLEG